jgi:hypothetical protein
MVKTRKNSFQIDKRTLKGWGRTHQQRLGDRKRRKQSLWSKFCEFCGIIGLGIIFVAIFS